MPVRKSERFCSRAGPAGSWQPHVASEWVALGAVGLASALPGMPKGTQTCPPKVQPSVARLALQVPYILPSIL